MGKLSRLRLLSKSKKNYRPDGVNSEEIEALLQSIGNKNIRITRIKIKQLKKESLPDQKLNQNK